MSNGAHSSRRSEARWRGPWWRGRSLPTGIARVGFFGADPSVPPFWTQAFIDELQIHGFKNGQNLFVDFRRLEQDLRALSADAAELVRSNVKVLVTQGPGHRHRVADVDPPARRRGDRIAINIYAGVDGLN